ncbi:MAG: hypothetical protein O3C28_12985 [Proteobacteria bacterium]|nr:hypothetical protein [Pseudomonadota bacterium]
MLGAKVKARLFTSSYPDATKVKVVTENGIVNLMGILTREDSDIAAAATGQDGGVQ